MLLQEVVRGMEKSPSQDQDQIKAHFQTAEEFLALKKEDGLRLGGGRWEKKKEDPQKWAGPENGGKPRPGGLVTPSREGGLQE